ncbi:hypothetical protein ABZ793_32990 [Micromonospora sp. NPDC047465]|uniref:hypothetical protein n=1 Tax=Micromonospora sp. NPDC047465 TaxID=3154813 RepID=UPI0033E5A56E
MRTWSDRHPATRDIARHFNYEHLPQELRDVSQQFHDLAEHLIVVLPDSPELTAGLRKLLEAKDCAVRARKAAHDDGTAATEPTGSRAGE